MTQSLEYLYYSASGAEFDVQYKSSQLKPATLNLVAADRNA